MINILPISFVLFPHVYCRRKVIRHPLPAAQKCWTPTELWPAPNMIRLLVTCMLNLFWTQSSSVAWRGAKPSYQLELAHDHDSICTTNEPGTLSKTILDEPGAIQKVLAELMQSGLGRGHLEDLKTLIWRNVSWRLQILIATCLSGRLMRLLDFLMIEVNLRTTRALCQ